MEINHRRMIRVQTLTGVIERGTLERIMKTMMEIGIATIQITGKSAAIGAPILLLSCLVLLSAGCGVLETETIENSLRVDDEATIEVETGKGFILIEAGPTGGIGVTAELRDPENVEYSVTRTGDTITVRARTHSWGAEADITVTVPEPLLVT